MFGQYPSYYFLLGALLVSLSVGLYGTKPEQSSAFYAACAEACREPTWLLELRTSDSAQRLKARCEMLQVQAAVTAQHSIASMFACNGLRAGSPSAAPANHTESVMSQVNGLCQSNSIIRNCSSHRARMHGYRLACDCGEDEIDPALQQRVPFAGRARAAKAREHLSGQRDLGRRGHANRRSSIATAHVGVVLSVVSLVAQCCCLRAAVELDVHLLERRGAGQNGCHRGPRGLRSTLSMRTSLCCQLTAEAPHDSGSPHLVHRILPSDDGLHDHLTCSPVALLRPQRYPMMPIVTACSQESSCCVHPDDDLPTLRRRRQRAVELTQASRCSPSRRPPSWLPTCWPLCCD